MGWFDDWKKPFKDMFDKQKRLEDKIKELEAELTQHKSMPASVPTMPVDPIALQQQIVYVVTNTLLADQQEIKQAVIRKLTEGIEIDTDSIESNLSESEDFEAQVVREVLVKMDMADLKQRLTEALVTEIVDNQLNLDDLESKVAEIITERIRLKLNEA